jgi:hypothetical protein
MAKGFRTEKTKEDMHQAIKDSLSAEEAHFISELRQYDSLKPDSLAWKLALHNDTLRTSIRNQQEQIFKRIWNIKDIQNKIDRANLQLSTKEIYEKIGDSGITMNEDELKTYIEHMRWVKKGEVRDIAKQLLQLRANVGHIDLQRNIIMTEEQYEEYVQKIMNEIKGLGHDIFE